MTQKVRLSQYVLTYGPGAILEGQGSSRVIPTADIGLFGPQGIAPQTYEVSDPRMSQGLLGGARIHRLPSNAELNEDEDRYLYITRPFPEWLLCQAFRTHQGRHAVLFRGRDCPECPPGRNFALRPAPVRFVMACRSGHLDDVNWPSMAHGRGAPCARGTYLRWHAGGGSLGDIEVECPACRRRERLGRVYGLDWRCTGRSPEREAGGHGTRNGCQTPARIIQKQASNLRVPELRTLFTIPPRYTRLHNLLQLAPIYYALATLRATNAPLNATAMTGVLNSLADEHHAVPRAAVDEILATPWPEVEEAIRDLFAPIPADYEGLIREEYEALVRASDVGAPPLRGPQPTSPVVFHVDPNKIRRFAGPLGTRLRVVPVLTLRTVTAQLGFRREVDTRQPGEVVDVSFVPPGAAGPHWFPGAEFLGEGVFIILEPDDPGRHRLSGEAARTWIAAMGSGSYPEYLFRGPPTRTELHPGFVWWHTLSHLLLRATSVEAGYSSASIRERVYLNLAPGRARGGILLYATQPGTDGTLGGLIALVPSFDAILESAFDAVQSCSGDPLCGEHRFADGQYNGAACYACLLVSETSCEHRNMWLDRTVLQDNLP